MKRRSIAGRVILFLTLALLPAGLIAVLHTRELAEQLQEQSEAALEAFTGQAAMRERDLIQRAFGAAEALSLPVLALLNDHDRCSEAFANFASATDAFSAAGFVAHDASIGCVSGRTDLDLTESELVADLLERPRPHIQLVEEAPISGHPVLVVWHPLFNRGKLLGYIFVSVPHHALDWTEGSMPNIPGIALMTFNKEGEVLTSNPGGPDHGAKRPADLDLAALTGAGAFSFAGQSTGGGERVFTVVPVVHDVVYAVGSLPWPPPTNGPIPAYIPTWTFPILMWLISLAVALLAMHYLVIRHVRDMTGAMRLFADDRKLPGDERAEAMPAELAEIYQTFHSMAEKVVRDEAEMENAMHEKTVLLREVHHRVKNNLQLISSIMNLQMRQISSADGRSAIKRLQERVLGLATIHRSLYRTENLAEVDAKELLGDLVNQIVRMGTEPRSGITVKTDFEPILLYPDQAVPLSLLVTEAVTNALKYIGRSGDGPPEIRASLRATEGRKLELSVSNTTGADQPDPARKDGSGLGNDLINAFAMQLGAETERFEADGEYHLRLRFERQIFAPERADIPN